MSLNVIFSAILALFHKHGMFPPAAERVAYGEIGRARVGTYDDRTNLNGSIGNFEFFLGYHNNKY